jgi:hypothetical protein
MRDSDPLDYETPQPPARGPSRWWYLPLAALLVLALALLLLVGAWGLFVSRLGPIGPGN